MAVHPRRLWTSNERQLHASVITYPSCNLVLWVGAYIVNTQIHCSLFHQELLDHDRTDDNLHHSHSIPP
jgi:hypothetical protein